MTTRCPNHLNRRAVKRGVCLTCYNMLAQRVQRGLTTWPELETQGLVTPQAPRGRPRKEMKPL